MAGRAMPAIESAKNVVVALNDATAENDTPSADAAPAIEEKSAPVADDSSPAAEEGAHARDGRKVRCRSRRNAERCH